MRFFLFGRITTLFRRGALPAATGLLLTACGGGGSDDDPVNHAPEFVSADQVNVAENTLIIQTVLAQDPDGDSLSFSISGGVDAIYFTIEADTGVLSFRGARNYEFPVDDNQDNDYQVEITVEDGPGSKTVLPLTVTVTDEQEPPSITSETQVDVPENTTLAYQAVGTDPEGQGLTWSLDGGSDAGALSLDSSTGALTFLANPDYENPADSDADNVYEIVIGLEDGDGQTASETISISVTEQNEAPVISSAGSVSVPENISEPYTLTATDPDGDTLSYHIVGGDDSDLFLINTSAGMVRFIESPDFENPQDSDSNREYQLTLEARDNRGSSTQLAVAITITDVARDIRSELPFPSPAAHFAGYVNDIEMVGKLRDLEGNEITAGDINSIHVDGNSVSPDSGDPSRWYTALAVSEQDHTVPIEVDTTSGLFTDMAELNNAPFFTAEAVTLDTVNNRALLAGEKGTGKIVAVDLDTQSRYLLTRCADLDEIHFLALNGSADGLVAAATPSAGSVALWWLDLTGGTCQKFSGDGVAPGGPSLGDVGDLVLDEANDRVLTLDTFANAILEIDLEDGSRQIFSDNNTGSGPDYDTLRSIALDAGGGRLLVGSDGSVDKLFEVDLDTGERMVVSDTVALGPAWAMAVSEARNRAYLVAQTGSIQTVNLATGLVDVIINRDPEGFPLYLGTTRDLAVDDAADRILIATENEAGIPRLISADLEEGDKTMLSNTSIGDGFPFSDSLFLTAYPPSGVLWVADSDPSTGLNGIVEVQLEDSSRERQLDNSFDGKSMVTDKDNDRLLIVGRADTQDQQIQLVELLVPGYQSNVLADYFDPDMQEPEDMVLDAANNRVLVTDSGLDALVALELDTFDRTIISDAVTGMGPPTLTDPGALVLDEANNRAILVDAAVGLVAVDLATGDRTDLLSAQPDSSNPDAFFDNIALDPNGGSPLVYGVDGDRIMVADVVADSLTELSGPVGSEGPAMTDLRDIFLNTETGIAWVLDFTGVVFEVNTASGQRAILSR